MQADAPLRRFVAAELDRTVLPEARALAAAIRERHEGAAAVLFYGSCLRDGTAEGVLDFYVLVDGYRAASLSWPMAFANWCLPPNVFYLECEAPPPDNRDSGGTSLAADARVRCKYALVSLDHFEALTARGARHPYLWARFAQPCALAFVRDAEVRARTETAVAEALLTFCERLVPFMPTRAGAQRFSLAAFWQQALLRTYGSELRPESPERVRSYYGRDAKRYDESALLAFEALAARGRLTEVEEHGPAVEIRQSAVRRLAGRMRWRLLWPLAKSLAVLRLLKTAFTFGDWLPYALWKLERHTGERVELSERQRRHPLLFAWPEIFKLVAGRRLR